MATAVGQEKLAAADAGLEDSLGGWVPSTGLTFLDRDSTQARTGNYSLALTAAGGGTAEAKTTPASSGSDFSAVGGGYYRIGFGSVADAAAASRQTQLVINWYDAAGAYINSFVVSQTDNTAGWTYSRIETQAPGNAARWEAYAQVLTPAVGEIHYFDDFTVRQFVPVPRIVVPQLVESAAAVYTYIAYDLRTNDPVAELPLSGVTYTDSLNGDGTLSGYIAGGDAAGRLDLPSVLPGRTMIAVDRDGVLQGGYIYWDDDPQPGKLDLSQGSMRGLLSYFDRRRISTTLTFNQVDQLSIAEQIVAAMQAVDGGDIGIETAGYISYVLRDRTYPGAELKNVREALLQLAAVDDGFDLAINLTYGFDGRPRKTLDLYYPQRGDSVQDSGLVLEYPGNIKSYRWTRLGSEISTHVHGIGAGDGELALRAVAVNQNLIDAGWPVLELDVSFTDVSVLATLQEHVLAEALARRGMIVVPEITVGPDDPQLGSYSVGDEARVRITDDAFGGPGLAAQVDATARITDKAVAVSDTDGSETVTLTLSAVVVPL